MSSNRPAGPSSPAGLSSKNMAPEVTPTGVNSSSRESSLNNSLDLPIQATVGTCLKQCPEIRDNLLKTHLKGAKTSPLPEWSNPIYQRRRSIDDEERWFAECERELGPHNGMSEREYVNKIVALVEKDATLSHDERNNGRSFYVFPVDAAQDQLDRDEAVARYRIWHNSNAS